MNPQLSPLCPTCLSRFAMGIALFALTQVAPAQELRGSGDLGLVIERASGSVQLLDTTRKTALQRVDGLGDLSHASTVFSRDARYAYVFGRDGGLSKIDLLTGKIVKRVIQSGNSIGGAISQDGRIIAAANYTPGGVKFFDSETLELLSEIPARSEVTGELSKVVGLEDAAGNRFTFSLFEAGEIWQADLSKDPKNPKITRHTGIGKEPYDALVTSDGRWYIAGLFGEDGIAVLDLWHPERGVKRALPDYGKGEQKLPVYKMPHLETWAVAGNLAFIPGVGRHEVVMVDISTWQKVGTIPVAGQPVFVMAEPTGRRLWVNFAFPHYDTVQVIDVESRQIVHTMKPGKAVLHMEFTPRGEHVWISVRDENRIQIHDAASFEKIAEIPAQAPSGIFFSSRAHRTGL
ncbi:MAG: protein nirF [Hydrogenophilales bacterium 17-64-65]|nr:protein nirF [Gammaproteobacteria bacterium]OYZ26085.1 MAG: protein nirF [Hydrogenophilales bacterium 16-64-40]OZA32466.1 MAG: protein nirF [Hydrogenophilales bacterium 17-64-65]